MDISIFGLGYVGTVSMGCLSQLGHTVIGVDVNETKVGFINEGKSPIVEFEIDEIIEKMRLQKKISATTNVEEAINGSSVSFICVGTPSTEQGHLNLEGIFRVAETIGQCLLSKNDFHIVAIRSTVVPGTNHKVAEIIELHSKKKSGIDFAVISNPEFLREGTAVKDYFNPPYNLVGSNCKHAVKIMKELYASIEAPFIEASIGVAELMKYVNNSFHALKITFANEVGAICKSLGVNSHELMKIFCMDTKLNISPSYLLPGFAYGGSCLPKDLKALCTIAHDSYLKCPVLENVNVSNEISKERVLDLIMNSQKQKIGFLGLSFKAGTDDLRASPIIDIMEKLLGKGFEILIYDKNVHLSKLVGANKEYILKRIPFIARFITEDIDAVFAMSELVVIVNNDNEFKDLMQKCSVKKHIIDLVNLDFENKEKYTNYDGVNW